MKILSKSLQMLELMAFASRVSCGNVIVCVQYVINTQNDDAAAQCTPTDYVYIHRVAIKTH